MKYIIILFASIIGYTNAIKIKDIFEDWKLIYNKNYETSLENRYRFAVFSENYNNEEIHILNKFMDLTNDEIKLIY